MVEKRSDWLVCKKCNRRGKYSFNTKDISYNYEKKKLLLNWNLSCKFCNIPLNLQNLGNTSISMLYILILIRNLDDSV